MYSNFLFKSIQFIIYVVRWTIHEAVYTALDRPQDTLLYNFTASNDGLQWTLYIKYVTVSDIIVIY